MDNLTDLQVEQINSINTNTKKVGLGCIIQELISNTNVKEIKSVQPKTKSSKENKED